MEKCSLCFPASKKMTLFSKKMAFKRGGIYEKIRLTKVKKVIQDFVIIRRQLIRI